MIWLINCQVKYKTEGDGSACAPNRFLAKIAFGCKKPDALMVITPERVEAFLQKLLVAAFGASGQLPPRSGTRLTR